MSWPSCLTQKIAGLVGRVGLHATQASTGSKCSHVSKKRKESTSRSHLYVECSGTLRSYRDVTPHW